MAKRARRKTAKKAGAPTEGASGLDLATDKLYFKIGEVAQIVDVPAYVLRYWETEFRSIKPQKSRSQQRIYRRRDVETLLRIKHLLYERKFTIAGARQQLKEHAEGLEMAAPSGLFVARQSLGKIKAEIEALSAIVHDEADAERGADPAAYLQAIGGARVLFERPNAQALLQRTGGGARRGRR
ncbi:MAG: MerR family transcriptional regulator [Myxococcales bacterium]|nr:MerR family transcriptional regulator [Myxococcales bacterium]MCA9695660.1 MerR family transcriptional regulator [Myxococcales bacterium]